MVIRQGRTYADFEHAIEDKVSRNGYGKRHEGTREKTSYRNF